MKIKRAVTTALIGCGILGVGLLGDASADQGVNSCEPTELVKNGSFEEPYVGFKRWKPFQQIDGWTLDYGPAIEVQNHVAGSPQDGEQFVELDSHASSGISQEMETVAGHTYTVSFWFSPRPGRSAADNEMAMLWDGQEVTTMTADGTSLRDTDWTYHEFDLTASGSITRLAFHHIGSSNSHGAYVDAVSVTDKDECGTQAASPFKLYDDFSTKRIDSGRWFGQESASGGPGGLELVRRRNRHGQLVMMHRVSGGDESSSGRHISRNRLRMPREQRVMGMHFDVMVKRVKLSGCEVEGASASAVKARGAMFLFNDGSSTSSSNATGDVGAVVEAYQSVNSAATPNEFRLRGFVFRCRTRSCGSTSTVGSVDLGTVQRYDFVTLGMQWHPETDEVTFWKNDEERHAVSYDMNDDERSVFSNQRLEVRVEGANCEEGERPYAEMRAIFDNVFIQP